MFPILFKAGPFVVHTYGFFYALAFLIGIFISIYYARKVAIKDESILDLAIYVILTAIVGARIFYVLGQWSYYKDNLFEVFMIQKGGLAFLGGFLLVLAVIFMFSKAKKIVPLRLFDVLAPAAAIGSAIGRLGCFFNGCCFGVPTDSPFGIVFPPGSLAHSQYSNELIHPTQLYASLSMLFVFFFVVYLWRRRKYDGQIFFSWLILYSLSRFTVEFFRYCPSDLYFFGLNPGQIIALGLFAGGVCGVIVCHGKKT